MKISKTILAFLLIPMVSVPIIYSGCNLVEVPDDFRKISVDFTFEVQVLDSLSRPLPGVLVYFDTRKHVGYEEKGVYEFEKVTDSDGWVVKYMGYELNNDSENIEFHASLRGFDDMEPPVFHKYIYWDDMDQAAGDDDHITYTVTGFLEGPLK